jgi:hypothetical protein
MLFESAQFGYKPSTVSKLLKAGRGPAMILPESLMAYLNDYKPKRGPYRPTMRGKSKRRSRGQGEKK